MRSSSRRSDAASATRWKAGRAFSLPYPKHHGWLSRAPFPALSGKPRRGPPLIRPSTHNGPIVAVVCFVSASKVKRASFRAGPRPSFTLVRAAGDFPAALLRHQLTISISLGRQLLSKNGSSGLYSRRSVFQPFPGTVCIQLPSLIPAGLLANRNRCLRDAMSG